MNKQKIILYALINALGTVIYVTLVANFMFFLENSHRLQEDTVLGPIAFLLLLVLSVAATGMLVFGRPVYWYLDGFKKASVELIVYTLGFLLLFTVLIFCLFLRG